MTLSSKFFGTLCIEVGETHFVGDTPGGRRRIDVFRGNVTGLSLQFTDLAGKRLELLREVVPGLRQT